MGFGAGFHVHVIDRAGCQVGHTKECILHICSFCLNDITIVIKW